MPRLDMCSTGNIYRDLKYDAFMDEKFADTTFLLCHSCHEKSESKYHSRYIDNCGFTYIKYLCGNCGEFIEVGTPYVF